MRSPLRCVHEVPRAAMWQLISAWGLGSELASAGSIAQIGPPKTSRAVRRGRRDRTQSPRGATGKRKQSRRFAPCGRVPMADFSIRLTSLRRRFVFALQLLHFEHRERQPAEKGVIARRNFAGAWPCFRARRSPARRQRPEHMVPPRNVMSARQQNRLLADRMRFVELLEAAQRGGDMSSSSSAPTCGRVFQSAAT